MKRDENSRKKIYSLLKRFRQNKEGDSPRSAKEKKT